MTPGHGANPVPPPPPANSALEGVLAHHPLWRVPDTGVLDIEERLGDLHSTARVSRYAEPESLC